MTRAFIIASLFFQTFLIFCGFSCGGEARKVGAGQVQTEERETTTSDPVSPLVSVEPGTQISAQTPESVDIGLPAAPAPPTIPVPLNVEGFKPASHVGPDDGDSWPKPVVIVLHGNFDRPEWECDVWKDVAGFYGWVLCPRGVRTPWATKAEDRWTYNGAGAVRREIKAGLVALETRYPGRVTREGMVLAGFSLGAILSPKIVELDPGVFPYMFMVEGGAKKLDVPRVKSMARSGVKGIGLAMSAPGRRSLAKKLLPILKKRNIDGVFVDMKGAGHGYRGDFQQTGRAALRRLLNRDVDGQKDEGTIE